jgi:hypothetical protein
MDGERSAERLFQLTFLLYRQDKHVSNLSRYYQQCCGMDYAARGVTAWWGRVG